MKFKDYGYIRPEITTIAGDIKALTEKFKNAESLEEAIKLIEQVQVLKDSVDSMNQIASIRHSINSLDEFYEAEMEYFSENSPVLESATTLYSKALISSKYKKDFVNYMVSIGSIF